MAGNFIMTAEQPIAPFTPAHGTGRSIGSAWLALTLALALHVIDEATHDFLSVYNPSVLAVRQRFPLLPLPTFTFSFWLAGLVLAVLGLLALSPLAFRNNRWLVRLSYPFAALMFANGVGHVAYSLYRDAFMPGIWSSPLLLAASVWLFIAARQLSARQAGHLNPPEALRAE
jgi:hypothetical protein